MLFNISLFFIMWAGFIWVLMNKPHDHNEAIEDIESVLYIVQETLRHNFEYHLEGEDPDEDVVTVFHNIR